MFISTRKHLAVIQEIRYYWSKELDKARTENARLTAQLGAKASFKAAQETALPAPLPAAREPELVIVHLVPSGRVKTSCGEHVLDLNRPGGNVLHLFTGNPSIKLNGPESWCADCLG